MMGFIIQKNMLKLIEKDQIIMQQTSAISLPIVISQEGKWFVASCPLLDIATQGITEKEVRENMQELINDYFSDPDTKKPSMKEIKSSSVSIVNMPVKVGGISGRYAKKDLS